MRIKTVLRFYFSAEKLNCYLDKLTVYTAVASGGDPLGGCERYADKIFALIEVKENLSAFWARLNSVLQSMTEKDRQTLRLYAALRCTPKWEERKEVHRAVVKFTRRAGRLLERSAAAYKTLSAYRCLLSPAPNKTQ